MKPYATEQALKVKVSTIWWVRSCLWVLLAFAVFNEAVQPKFLMSFQTKVSQITLLSESPAARVVLSPSTVESRGKGRPRGERLFRWRFRRPPPSPSAVTAAAREEGCGIDMWM